jgi:hypothetical protein
MVRSVFLIPAIILIVIIFAVIIIGALAFAPFNTVNFGQTNHVVNQPNVKTLNFNFQADIAKVSIIAQNFTDDTVLLYTSGTGSTGIFGSNNPVQIVFSNETAGNTLTVNSKVTTSGLFARASEVTCDIFINPSVTVNLNVTTETGQISLTSNQGATFESLNLKSTTGLVQANIENGTVIAGDISLKTTTGAVSFRMNQANVQGNDTFNLQTTTGAVDLEITENKALSGNVQVNAATTTGAVNLAMNIDNGVGARIESQTQIGEITTDLNNFSGNKSPIESNNYPAESNFLVTLRTSVGGISINAVYQSSSAPSIRN